MTKTITEIQTIVNQLAEKINAPSYLLPTFSSPIGDATPNIEVDNSGLYNYVISERGNEYERKLTSDLNELLYWIFSSVSFSMACDYELKNRVEDKDCRRIIFEKQEELLGILDKKWEEKERKEHLSILVNSPFDDLAGLRATYCGELRAKGFSEAEIDKLAYEKYPE
ncbi:Imm63 family immunity protein [Winogradskyella pulchriflava]|uniref:Imm63 family immunity protein n=1 Tax=Winogradskyella pulchriflava TaxID=1110688 RepID=A0ABV6QAB6_9FLAO